MSNIEPVQKEHILDIMVLCKAEGYESYYESEDITWNALTAPGVTSLVAVDGDKVLGFVQMLSDGLIQAHLSLILVAPDCRRQGFGRRLIEEAFKSAGGKRIDLLTDSADEFYFSFLHQSHWQGYRIFPGKK